MKSVKVWGLRTPQNLFKKNGSNGYFLNLCQKKVLGPLRFEIYAQKYAVHICTYKNTMCCNYYALVSKILTIFEPIMYFWVQIDAQKIILKPNPYFAKQLKNVLWFVKIIRF